MDPELDQMLQGYGGPQSPQTDEGPPPGGPDTGPPAPATATFDQSSAAPFLSGMDPQRWADTYRNLPGANGTGLPTAGSPAWDALRQKLAADEEAKRWQAASAPPDHPAYRARARGLISGPRQSAAGSAPAAADVQEAQAAFRAQQPAATPDEAPLVSDHAISVLGQRARAVIGPPPQALPPAYRLTGQHYDPRTHQLVGGGYVDANAAENFRRQDAYTMAVNAAKFQFVNEEAKAESARRLATRGPTAAQTAKDQAAQQKQEFEDVLKLHTHMHDQWAKADAAVTAHNDKIVATDETKPGGDRGNMKLSTPPPTLDDAIAQHHQLKAKLRGQTAPGAAAPQKASAPPDISKLSDAELTQAETRLQDPAKVGMTPQQAADALMFVKNEQTRRKQPKPAAPKPAPKPQETLLEALPPVGL